MQLYCVIMRGIYKVSVNSKMHFMKQFITSFLKKHPLLQPGCGGQHKSYLNISHYNWCINNAACMNPCTKIPS